MEVKYPNATATRITSAWTNCAAVAVTRSRSTMSNATRSSSGRPVMRTPAASPTPQSSPAACGPSTFGPTSAPLASATSFAPIANDARQPTRSSAPPTRVTDPNAFAPPKPTAAATGGATTQITASVAIVGQCTPTDAPTATPTTAPTRIWIVEVGMRIRL